MKKIIISAIITLMVLPMLSYALPVSADYNSVLWNNMAGDVRDATGLGEEDPRIMASSIIQVLLGFLGIIAVLIVLFGGFKWMTAGGDEGKVGEAKKILGAGVVGLIIVLSAYGLANMALKELYDATT